jgi:delta 1-pyrroline-5-carboxylate dehydrogenase
MKSSRNGQSPRAHYRDRHLSLNDLPARSTEHGFRPRVKKTSNEDLRRQAHQPPMIGVFSLRDGSVQAHHPSLSITATTTSMVHLTKLFIDGKWVPASTGETFEVHNPYSGAVVGHAASASSADCTAAVDAAARAFRTWELTSPNTRRDLVLKAADLFLTPKYKERIHEAMTEEVSAAAYWSTFNQLGCVGLLRAAAGTVDLLTGDAYASGSVPGAQAVAQRRAQGVIFGIAPWNAPVSLSIRAILVPIMCGNTTVLKCSEVSPKSQAIVAEVFEEAGFPPGVLNFISISREAAPALTAEIIGNPHVRTINFTGSDRVGKIIAAEAAKYLKPCILELGGKAPAVVSGTNFYLTKSRYLGFRSSTMPTLEKRQKRLYGEQWPTLDRSACRQSELSFKAPSLTSSSSKLRTL